ncbi:MAG: type II toxin-antitoxin system VapC family toxin [Planctomycetes bacterium]|nr:type II toxin-antitoxin system VapC family toxin [Planctomycetota bacterium]
MRLLLDSHILLWAVDQPSQLSTAAALALQDPTNDLLVSAGSIWEIAIKVGLKKLTLSFPYKQWLNTALTDLTATLLPITVDYVDLLTTLPLHHRDPFDRLMVAQAVVEQVSIVSSDPAFDLYGVQRLW